MKFNRRLRTLSVGLTTASLAILTACSTTTSSSSSSSSNAPVGVALITKDSTNPFFVTMQKGAKEAAPGLGVNLTIASGSKDGDEDGQVKAIEQAVARGDKGILILSNGPSVETAIKKARAAGLFAIALDTPPTGKDVVDITFATDNREAGRLIGKWAAAQLNGKPANIAQLVAFTDKVISVDYLRDQGFLEGMGINTADANKNGDEAKTGNYSGGTYNLACLEPGGGAEDGGRTGMETCLQKDPKINVVYTINEPTAVGARAALKAAGITEAVVVSVDGGCAGVKNVKDGLIGATSQQYPLKMATLGMEAIVKLARTGQKPTTSDGLDFFNTGVQLVTDKPVAGIPSIDTAKGLQLCWG